MPTLKKYKIAFYLYVLLSIANNTTVYASKIDTLFVWSKSMNKQVPNLVIVPSNYYSSKTKFPVLFLLHGAGDNFLGWIQISPELKNYADNYKMIIVCPDGGETSWYFDSPVDKSVRYETYITSELITAINTKYKAATVKNGRAISGLSMGGHGALYLSIRHQNIFGAVGSISGAVDFRPFYKNWDLAKRLGNYQDHKKIWDDNTVINMLPSLTGSLRIIFDCGVNDFFYSVNKRLHEEMLTRKIPHDYIERPGEHNVEYWHNAIKYHMVFFNDFFNESRGK